jgi:hypothetical protein
MKNKFDIELEKRLFDKSYDQKIALSIFNKRKKRLINKSLVSVFVCIISILSILQITIAQEDRKFAKAVQDKYQEINYGSYQIIDYGWEDITLSVCINNNTLNSQDMIAIWY